MASYTCPRCNKVVPGGESGGHCAACHENFRGGAAFDKHFTRHLKNGATVKLECQNPAEAVSPTGKPLDYWLDEKGCWHLGPRDSRFSEVSDD